MIQCNKGIFFLLWSNFIITVLQHKYLYRLWPDVLQIIIYKFIVIFQGSKFSHLTSFIRERYDGIITVDW